MFGNQAFGQPFFADPGLTTKVIVPACAFQFQNGFDQWLNGVPVIIPQSPGDFSEWINGVPCVDLGASALVFSGSGIAKSAATLTGTARTSVSGTGIAASSALLTGAAKLQVSGSGVASSSASLSGSGKLIVSGYGVAESSAQLSAVAVISISASGSGVASSSAVLSGITPPVVGHSRRASPRQSHFRRQDYAAHGFSYRRVDAGQEIVRHIGD